MKNSLFWKIFGAFVITILALTALILIISFETIRIHYKRTQTEQLEHLARALTHNYLPYLENKNYENLDSRVKELGERINTRITVITPEGEVVADSEEDPRVMDNHRGRPEITRALNDKIGTMSRYSKTVKEEMLYVAAPVKKGDTITAVVRVSLYLNQLRQLTVQLRLRIFIAAMIIIVLSLMGAFFVSSNLTKPLRQLSAASRAIASGNFDTHILLKGHDELSRVAEGFNTMTDTIRGMFEELKEDKEALNTILSSIEEALFVIDKEGRILLCNESFLRLVHDDTEVKDRYYWEVIRESELGDLIKKISPVNMRVSGKVEIHDKQFMCGGMLLPRSGEIVLTLHDITDVVTVAKVKKDLITNVSHELRTPLTAIKGFVETIEETVDEQNRQYLDIIKRHTERIINIINDLLTLVKLEEHPKPLQLEEVDLKNLIGNITTIFKQRLADNNLTVTVDIGDDVHPIMADPFRLEQIFINLISNAIKYTDEGGIAISVERHDEHNVRIEVADTGIGIPPEHLSRIFERFYVVDKSRSQKGGGTGLGLSIVKHIVLLHNGTIRAESTPGKGTTFIIVLAIKKGAS